MNLSILPGVIRGLGKARIKFDLAYKNKKIGRENFSKFALFEKLNLKDKEFSRTALFKTLKYFSDSEPEEVLFWTILKLIHVEENGGICVPKKNLIEFILKKNSSLDPEKSWNSHFSSNSTKSLLVEDMDMIYLSHLYSTEISVCESLKSFFEISYKEKFKPYKDNNLSDEQSSIVNSIFKNSISFLCGGPGTGKTTIIQSILKSGIDNNILPSDIAILAPTGKAAKRLQESCNQLLMKFSDLQRPSTIHRFLGYNPSSGKCKFNAENPSLKKLIIVDESSMIDIFILKALLDSLPNSKENRRLIFVGDPDQLLSVNSGSIFSDLIQLNKNVFKLTKSFRQTSEGEDIKYIASIIQKKNVEENIDLLHKQIQFKKEIVEISPGFHFIETAKDDDSVSVALAWYKNLSLRNLSGQILTPYNETKIGIHNLNSFILKDFKKNLHPQKLPVIVNSNLYNLELFNGESGYLIESGNVLKFFPQGEMEIDIPKSYRQFFESAFAITVHKSQGSEYDHVCLLLPELEEPDSLLNIRILYTAITRAKISISVIGSFSLFKKALSYEGVERFSRIVARLS